MWFHFLCLVAVAASAEEPLYKKIGDKVVLTPHSVENDINNMKWMYGNDEAMWYRYGGEPLFFGQFKARGSLDISTGVMTITGLTRDDSGNYTAEINGKETSKTQVHVISPVPKPSISVWCHPEKTYCVFTCIGSTTGAEPVTYWWTADGKRWPSTRGLIITKEDKEWWFSCTLENPVSSSSSKKVFNPFIKEPLYKKIGDKVVLTPGSVKNYINDIRWMYGNDEAMWYRYGGEPLFFRQFKARGSLDNSTGEMTITGLTRDDSGIYTAEINNKITSKTKLLVISPVPEPVLYVLCDPEMTYCVYTCSGNITGAEPVTYWWTAGEKRWNSIKELKITKENKERWFSCELKNPVSSNSSEKVFNPLITDNTWKLIYLIIPISLAGLIIAVYFRHKYRKSFKPQWQFVRLSKGWWNFRKTTDPPNICSVTSDDIEKWFQERPQDKMPFTVKGDPYELDFDEMIQTNLEDDNACKVRRVMVPPEYKAVFCPHCA